MLDREGYSTFGETRQCCSTCHGQVRLLNRNPSEPTVMRDVKQLPTNKNGRFVPNWGTLGTLG